MPPDGRQVDVEHVRGERSPVPTCGAAPEELAAAVGTRDAKFPETKLLPDERTLGRIVDLIAQTIVVLNPAGRAIYANQVTQIHGALSGRSG